LKYRHDLASGTGKAMRGWKGLALVEGTVAENLKNESVMSDEVLSLGGDVKSLSENA
jgi:hypothetical protein